jgi:O-antigen/teichoic acid export membrane protein
MPAASELSAPCEQASAARRPRPRLARVVAAVLRDPFAQKGVLSVIDQAIVSGTSFATSVIIGRLCSKEDLGLYYLALSIILIVRGVQEQLIATPYRIHCNRQHGESLAGYTGSMLVHQSGLVVLTMFGLLGLVGLTALGLGPADLAPAVWALLGAVPFLLLRECVRQVAFARLEMATAIGWDLIVSVLQIGGLLVLWHLHLLSVVTAYLVLGGAGGAALFGWLYFRRESWHITAARILPDWRRNWSLAKWALGSLLVSSATPYIGPWLLASCHGVTATGVLAACTSVAGLSQMLLMGMNNYLSSQSARAYACGGAPELRRVLIKSAVVFAVTIGGFCLILVVAGDAVLTLAYGTKYAGHGDVIAAAAVYVLAIAFGNVAGNGLWAIERSQAHFKADLGALLVTLVATFYLIPPLGPLGAALAALAGAVSGTIVRIAAMWPFLEGEPT